MSKKVYVVTAGCCSDYGIRAIFSSRAKAEKYMTDRKTGEPYTTDFNDVEEWTLDEGLKERSFREWFVGIMLDDGSLYKGKGPESRLEWGIPKSRVELVNVGVDRTMAYAYSHKSAEHAIKLATEKRQEWLRAKAVLA